MRRAGPVLALFALLATAPAAIAQAAPSSFEERTGWPLPQSGIYYDPTQPGVAFSFDIGLDGTLLGGFAAYGADGASTFYTVHGRLSREDLPAADAGIVGALRSPVHQSRRIGAADDPAARVVTEAVPALGEAVVRFVEPRRLTLDIAGQRWNMQRIALTEDPAQWISGRFLMLVEARADAPLRGPVLAGVSIGPPLRMQSLPAPSDGVCSGAGAVADARFVTCESGCGAFHEWAGGPLSRVLVWSNGDGTTWQLGRYVEGGEGLVPLPGGVQYTLSPSPQSLDALPQARGCRVPGEALRLYRQPLPSPTVDTPRGPQEPDDPLGSLRASLWWDPGRPGVGLMVDVGGRLAAPVATGLVAMFDFRADGSADFTTVVGPVASAGAAGTPVLQSPIYRHRDGQCIGCPWRAPGTTADERSLRFAIPADDGSALTATTLRGEAVERRVTYTRVPFDRSAFDEVQGRWLLRVADPAQGRFGADGLPVPIHAEVVVEPLAGTFLGDRSAGNPAYRLRCVRGCAAYARWIGDAAGTDAPAEVAAVLWFSRTATLDAPPAANAFDASRATLGVYARGTDGWTRVPQSPAYPLDLRARDRYRSRGDGYRGDAPATGAPAGRIDLFRNPPRVLGD